MLDRAVFRFSIDALVIILGAPSVRGLALPDAAEPSPSRASLNGLDGINFFNAAILAGFGPYVAVNLAEQKWTQENIGFVLAASGLAGLLALIPGHLPGDIFGLETGDEHTFSAEAITDCKIIVIKRSTVMALGARDNDVARQTWELTACELRRVQEHSLVLIKSAEERVAGFLLEMAERVPSGGAVELPMSRQDIADYLGLTIETVSRTLKHLENAAAIEVPKRRRILLRNRSALRRLNA